MRSSLFLVVNCCFFATAACLQGAEPSSTTHTLWDCEDTAGISGLVLERENVKQGEAVVK